MHSEVKVYQNWILALPSIKTSIKARNLNGKFEFKFIITTIFQLK